MGGGGHMNKSESLFIPNSIYTYKELDFATWLVHHKNTVDKCSVNIYLYIDHLDTEGFAVWDFSPDEPPKNKFHPNEWWWW